jgi:hypothetical protein
MEHHNVVYVISVFTRHSALGGAGIVIIVGPRHIIRIAK